MIERILRRLDLWPEQAEPACLSRAPPSIPPPDGGERIVELCFDDPFPDYDTEPVMAHANDPDFAASEVCSELVPNGDALPSTRRRGRALRSRSALASQFLTLSRVSRILPSEMRDFTWCERRALRDIKKPNSYHPPGKWWPRFTTPSRIPGWGFLAIVPSMSTMRMTMPSWRWG